MCLILRKIQDLVMRDQHSIILTDIGYHLIVMYRVVSIYSQCWNSLADLCETGKGTNSFHSYPSSSKKEGVKSHIAELEGS
jgi:hypothetical protein